jgi:hypothetical protein
MTTTKRTTRRPAAPADVADPSATPVKAKARQAPPRRAKARTSSKKPRVDEDRRASIAKAAYFRSEHRGFKPGYELEDWLAAEEEVNQRLGERID